MILFVTALLAATATLSETSSNTPKGLRDPPDERLGEFEYSDTLQHKRNRFAHDFAADQHGSEEDVDESSEMIDEDEYDEDEEYDDDDYVDEDEEYDDEYDDDFSDYSYARILNKLAGVGEKFLQHEAGEHAFNAATKGGLAGYFAGGVPGAAIAGILNGGKAFVENGGLDIFSDDE
mmetsp:Transcript_33661/g.52623  ORF Transcript_33661/g.52623 Transcript_33661/m.52623 type:complete len:177 (-) Transcript_33661:41-571(-)|eukprot:CAMPEP_0201521740 /NCGR_PEP_ID=MMETSP0161_2-20130828/15958_1 /ASSEMBLY_ACC=CAM_ASM_000251 /TAXON_ID=180227 /ORGANISM="Neoparamoeba aestuarina, Strain SoJaBio B1-5/56/2" /LENGTH=176 /DNA_ID=CAMNT_0047920435 /DNA_START=31 /DNA_END=561 /DNA_ORIENTATION=+